MPRDLSYEDFLFIDFKDNQNESSLVELMKHINPWLHAIVISFTFDDIKTEYILDESWIRFVNNKFNYNPYKRSIIFEIYSNAKNIIKNNLNEKEI